MKRLKIIAAACATAVMVTLGISVAAQDLNPLEKTYLTFSGPVELPGMTLQAGTYVFKLADTAGRNVVQVMSQDEKDVLGQFLFVQHTRTDTSTDTVVTFRETREGATPAVQFWYYPNEKIGKEFIYPKDQAERIAARTGVEVLSDDGRIEGGADIAALGASASADVQATETKVEAQVTEQPAQAAAPAQPTAAAGSLAGNRQPVGQESNDADLNASASVQDNSAAVGTSGQLESQTASNELPRTASPLALSGLLGMLSLFGAAGLRFFRG